MALIFKDKLKEKVSDVILRKNNDITFRLAEE